MPEWKDDRFNFDDEGEEWKTALARAAAKALYLKWWGVFGLIIAFAKNLCEDAEEKNNEIHEQVTKNFINENA